MTTIISIAIGIIIGALVKFKDTYKNVLYCFLIYSFMLSSCNSKPVDLRHEFGEVYAEYDKESKDTVYYIAYADTIVNDTIRSLYKEYRCLEFDSLSDTIHGADIFTEEHSDNYDNAFNCGDLVKADSIDDELYKVVFERNKNVTRLIQHVGQCSICRQIHNTINI